MSIQLQNGQFIALGKQLLYGKETRNRRKSLLQGSLKQE